MKDKPPEQRRKVLGERNTADLEYMLKSPLGQRFLARLFDAAGLFGTCYADNSNRVQYLLGRRSLALELYNDIKKLNPEALIKLEQNWESEQKHEH